MLKKPLKILGPVALLLVIILSLAAGCSQQKPATDETKPPERLADRAGQGAGGSGGEQPYLTIRGDGVERETQYTLEDLKSMEEALAGACYSTVNNWPVKKFFVGRGVLVNQLLQKAGIKEEAQKIIFMAKDGYKITLTREQLEGKRFSYPALLQGGTQGARDVPAILAWEYREEADDLSEVVPGKLRLLLGQQGLNDVVTAAYVKNVIAVEVLTAAPGQWEAVQASPAPGPVERGAEVVLSHPEQDHVRIYYTTDGSMPDVYDSMVYNPSASYFQPELNKPLPVDGPVTIKAMAVGFGKRDSQVTTFSYEIR